MTVAPNDYPQSIYIHYILIFCDAIAHIGLRSLASLMKFLDHTK
jgi:hypothetical protein